MNEYLRNFNYYSTIDSLRKSIKYYPLELQLTWMLEVLLLSAYMAHRDTCKVNYKDCHVFYFKDLLRLSKSFLNKEELLTLNTLIKFRNTYVHEGTASAEDYFKTLVYAERHNLLKLAEVARVELNLHVILYETFGVIE